MADNTKQTSLQCNEDGVIREHNFKKSYQLNDYALLLNSTLASRFGSAFASKIIFSGYTPSSNLKS